jgi:hypothetical protein
VLSGCTGSSILICNNSTWIYGGGYGEIELNSAASVIDGALVSQFGGAVTGVVRVNASSCSISNCRIFGTSRALEIASGVANTVVSDNQFSTSAAEQVRTAGTLGTFTGNRNCKVLETGAADNNRYSNNTGFGGSTIIGPRSLVENENFRNVRTWGAVGDGATDDAAAIQAAINALPAAGGIVYFPQGTYRIATTLTLPDKPVKIIGCGKGTVVNLGASAIAAFTMPSTNDYVFQDFAIRGTEIAGQRGWIYSSGSVVSSVRIVIERVSIPSGFGIERAISIEGGGSEPWSIIDCGFHISGPTQRLIVGSVAQPTTFSFTRFNQTGAGGIDYVAANIIADSSTFLVLATGFSPTSGLYVNSIKASLCIFEFASGDIYLHSASFFESCEFNGTCTLYLTGSSGSGGSVSGCVFLTGTPARYIQILNNEKVSVTGCVFEGFTNEAIDVNNSTNCTITGNVNCEVLETGSATGNFYSNNTGFFPNSIIIGATSVIDGQQTRQTTTTPYTVVVTDRTILIDATAGAKVVDLPTAASSKWRILTVKKIDVSAFTVTIDPAGAETIDGAGTLVVTTQYQSFTVQSDGTSWWIL